jgi:hypothetical protein
MTTHSLNRVSDTVINGPAVTKASMLDFWQWAMADLCDDDVKGFFAEWVVHKLLGIESPRRVSWANNDLVTSHGVTIEVKASAYWQSWKVLNEFGKSLPPSERKHGVNPDSTIRFGGLRARDSASTVNLETERILKSHLYVFAFQHEKDITRWNAMDLSQWEFYILRASEVASLAPGRTISLTKLRTIQDPLSANGFVNIASRLIDSVAKELSAV